MSLRQALNRTLLLMRDEVQKGVDDDALLAALTGPTSRTSRNGCSPRSNSLGRLRSRMAASSSETHLFDALTPLWQGTE
jgi:hypothetical protein